MDEKELKEEEIPYESESNEAPTESEGEMASDESAEQPKNTAVAGEIEKLRAETASLQDKFLRKCADLENYKKRVEKEKTDLLQYANEDIIREMLPVIDNFERALSHAAANNAEDSALKSLKDGIEHIINNMLTTLKKFGLEEIPAVGEKFDHSKHESIGHEASSSHEPGTIVKELQRGYVLKKRLLRPSLVIIASEAEETAKTGESSAPEEETEKTPEDDGTSPE